MSNALEPLESSQSLGLPEGVTISPTGMTLPKNLTGDQFLSVMSRLTVYDKGLKWALADGMLYGEANYGESYTKLMEQTGLEYQTLADMKYVANKVDPSRRRENLSLGHHREVASFPPAEQSEWLEKAEAEQWSCKTLRLELSRFRNPNKHHTLGLGKPKPAAAPAEPKPVTDVASQGNGTSAPVVFQDASPVEVDLRSGKPIEDTAGIKDTAGIDEPAKLGDGTVISGGIYSMSPLPEPSAKATPGSALESKEIDPSAPIAWTSTATLGSQTAVIQERVENGRLTYTLTLNGELVEPAPTNSMMAKTRAEALLRAEGSNLLRGAK